MSASTPEKRREGARESDYGRQNSDFIDSSVAQPGDDDVVMPQQQSRQQQDHYANDVGRNSDSYQDQLSGMIQHQPNASDYGSRGAGYVSGQQQQSFGEDPYQHSAGGGQEGGGTHEEDEYEDPEEMIREFGRHPMMDRVQEALYSQLLQTYERVSEELRDKNSDVKK